MSNEQLTHYGVLGMKWGVRRNRDNSGNSRPKHVGIRSGGMIRDRQGLTKKRTLAYLKNDLEGLKVGTRVRSVGMTKSRQEAYRKKDIARMKKKTASIESDILNKDTKRLESLVKKGSEALNKYQKHLNKNTYSVTGKLANSIGDTVVLENHLLRAKAARAANKVDRMVDKLRKKYDTVSALAKYSDDGRIYAEIIINGERTNVYADDKKGR